MALKIRLSRGGAKKRPFYHVVVADSRSPRDGRFIERVGSYNPMVPKEHAERIVLNKERIQYWLNVGALPSDRVARFLADIDLVKRPIMHEQTKQHLPKAKAQERMQEAKDAANLAIESPAEEAAAEAPAEEAAAEAPAEEAAAEAPAEKAAAEAPAEEAAAEAPAEEAAAEAPAEKAAAEAPAEKAAAEAPAEEKEAG